MVLPGKKRKEKKETKIKRNKKNRKKKGQRTAQWKRIRNKDNLHNVHMIFLSIKKKLFSTQFSFHFGGLGKKISGPYHLFSFLLVQPNTQKNFLFKVFHPPYFISKQSHPK